MPKAEIIKHPVEKIGDMLKRNAWGAVIESLVTVILGIILVAWPNESVKVITCVVGAFLIIKGAFQVINYFIVKGQNDFFNNGLLAGVISLLLGAALFLIGEEIVNIFRIVIGIWMVYEGLVRINTSIKLHAANIPAWKYVLILALIVLLLGIFVTFYSGAAAVLVGWMMILAGIISIVGDVMFIQNVNTISDAITGKSHKDK